MDNRDRIRRIQMFIEEEVTLRCDPEGVVLGLFAINM